MRSKCSEQDERIEIFETSDCIFHFRLVNYLKKKKEFVSFKFEDAVFGCERAPP